MTHHDENLQLIELKPKRPVVEASHVAAQSQSLLQEYYGSGRWKDIIEFVERPIGGFVKEMPEPILSGLSIPFLYFGSQAYKALGQKEKYVACLKILYSLQPYQDFVGAEYRAFIERGSAEYLGLKRSLGVEYLNNLQVTGLFQINSGCFVATACFDNPNAPEVRLLQTFRDRTLSQTVAGRWSIQCYYRLAPPIAKWIARSANRRNSVRLLLIMPVVAFLRRIGYKTNS